MKINVHSVHFTADQKLLAIIQSKLSKLEQFYDKIVSGEVFLRLDKGEKLKTHSKMLEIKINLPGGELFVKAFTNAEKPLGHAEWDRAAEHRTEAFADHSLPPLMLRIPSTKLCLHRRITFPPKPTEVSRRLNRPHRDLPEENEGERKLHDA